jgi:hypothetical protein
MANISTKYIKNVLRYKHENDCTYALAIRKVPPDNEVFSYGHIMKEITRYKKTNEYNEFIKTLKRKQTGDKRSEACQKMNICYGERCYLRENCPAYQNYITRRQNVLRQSHRY